MAAINENPMMTYGQGMPVAAGSVPCPLVSIKTKDARLVNAKVAVEIMNRFF